MHTDQRYTNHCVGGDRRRNTTPAGPGQVRQLRRYLAAQPCGARFVTLLLPTRLRSHTRRVKPTRCGRRDRTADLGIHRTGPDAPVAVSRCG
jgi:hypothetical protein